MEHEAPSAFFTACRALCPRCAEGKLFSGLLTIVETCAHCGLDLRSQEHGDGPSVFIGFVFCLLITVGALGLEFSLTPPLWVHFALWPLLTVGGCIVMLRFAKALLIAQQYRVQGTGLHDAQPKQ